MSTSWFAAVDTACERIVRSLSNRLTTTPSALSNLPFLSTNLHLQVDSKDQYKHVRLIAEYKPFSSYSEGESEDGRVAQPASINPYCGFARHAISWTSIKFITLAALLPLDTLN